LRHSDVVDSQPNERPPRRRSWSARWLPARPSLMPP
jgi:hypothetical protein